MPYDVPSSCRVLRVYGSLGVCYGNTSLGDLVSGSAESWRSDGIINFGKISKTDHKANSIDTVGGLCMSGYDLFGRNVIYLCDSFQVYTFTVVYRDLYKFMAFFCCDILIL